jgi:XTP/dITP diphosphohydrolase
MLLYITGNEHKIATANDYLRPFGISVEGKKVDGIVELQLDDVIEISKSKATQAFKNVQHPLLVSDAGWMFTALNGFPGAYMASVNRWFTAQDFLNLMKGKENREVILRECVTYIDKDQIKTFVCDNKGLVLEEASGDGTPLDQIVTFKEDGKTIAKCENEGILRIPQNELWNNVGKWLKENNIS